MKPFFMKRLALLTACLLLGGCGAPGVPEGRADAAGPRDEVTVIMGPSSEPAAGFDPAYGWGAGEHMHEPLIQSTLTVTTRDLQIGLDLAESFSVSPDALDWTVTIREDAVFTDGTPLTAEDVAFTYETVRTASSVNDFTMLDEAVALDRSTVRFHLNRPFSLWPYTMAHVGIVPKHAYRAETYGQSPIGSGRYMLAQWDKGQQVILSANPNYYGPAPKIKKVTVLFMEEDAAFLAVQAGQADLAYTAAAYAGQNPRGYALLSVESVDNRGINLPAVPPSVGADGVAAGNAVTCDLSMRRAISMGIDRQRLIDNVLDGYGTPAYSVCDKMPWNQEIPWHQNASETALDSEPVWRTLERGGWAPGADGVRVRDGVRASFPLLYPTGDSLRQSLAAEVANQLAAFGIEAIPEGVGWDTAYTRARSEPMIWGWGAHTPMELYNVYHTQPESGMARYSPYANETVDSYMDAALRASTLEESYALWQKAQWDGTAGVTLQGDIPWVWLVNVNHLYWARDGLRVAKQKIHPHGHGWSIVNNVDEWEWED